MYIFDRYTDIAQDVDEFLEGLIDEESLKQWANLRGMPESVRDEFFNGKMGGYIIPDNCGGAASSLVDRAICMTHLSRRTGMVLPVISELTDYALISAFLRFLDCPEANARLFPFKGARPVFSESFTEADFFDENFGIGTRVFEKDGALILTGAKTFVTDGEFASKTLVLASDETMSGKVDDVSLWMIPLHTEGVVTDPIDSAGQSILAPANITFNDVVLDSSWQLQTEGRLAQVLQYQYELRCIYLCAISTGLACAALDDTRAYVSTKVVRGEILAKSPQVHGELISMEAKVNAMEFFVRDAAEALETDDKRRQFDSLRVMMNYIPNSAVEVASAAVTIFGLHGYSRDVRIMRLLEDLRGNQLRQAGEQGIRDLLWKMLK